MTRLAHLSKTINIFVPVAGSPRDAGDRAAASRNKSASAPPRAWKEKETQDYFFARPQPQASSTPAALPFTRGRPRSPQGPDGSRARRNRARALRQPSALPPPQRPSDPHRLPGHDAAQLGLEAPHGPCGLGAEAQVGVAPRGAAHQQRDPRPLRHDAHLRRRRPPAAPFIPPASPRPPSPARWPQPIG